MQKNQRTVVQGEFGTQTDRVETADPHGRTDTTYCSTFPLTPLATDLLVNRFCIENFEEI